MKIILNNSSMVPIYEQLVNQIKNLIMREELEENRALPSVRVLANELLISALTVKKAYDRLEKEGWITTIHGKGSFVNPANRQLTLEARRAEIERNLEAVIDRAMLAGLNPEEIRQMIDIVLEYKQAEG